MSVTWIILAASAILFVNLAVSGLLLWLTCKLCRVGRDRGRSPTYLRSLATILLLSLLNVIVDLILLFLVPRVPTEFQLIALLALAAVSLAIIPVAIAIVLRPSFGKTVLVSAIWTSLGLGVGAGEYFVIKSTAMEAFVIPTGGMADTLIGYHKEANCPKCGLNFQVNASAETEKQPPEFVTGCVCPGCRYELQPKEIPPEVAGGDRVLIAKGLCERSLGPPNRLDIVVFTYPELPVKDNAPINYIKRLVGLPGETIGIHYGKLYVLDPSEGLKYDEGGVRPEDLWRREYMHADDPRALEWLKKGDIYKIIRKRPDQIEALKRLVYDDEHPASDLKEAQWKRWLMEDGDASWAEANPHGFSHPSSAKDQVDWLRYRHVLRGGNGKPELITDFMGYNTYLLGPQNPHRHPDTNWVGDLILECEATVERAEGELVLELSKGVDRFQARWDLSTGECSLLRIRGEESTTLDKKRTVLINGTHSIRFANVDDRLVVWIGKSLPFGDGVAYEPSRERGPEKENDLTPARIGVRKCAVTVGRLKLWRDNYFTLDPGRADVVDIVDWSDHEDWEKLRHLPAKTVFVQPEHYFCLGDNSSESSDSRSWGLVPKRYMIGRALMVYYPFSRAGSVQ